MNITMVLTGVPELLRAFELTDAGTRVRTIAAIKKGTEAVEAGALQRVPRKTGELAGTIRAEYSNDGMTGLVKVGYGKLLRRSTSATEAGKKRLATKRRRLGSKSGLGSYGPVIERGDPRRHRAAHPFLVPALTQATPQIKADVAAAPVAAGKAAGFAT